jgi:hypothetical protein
MTITKPPDLFLIIPLFPTNNEGKKTKAVFSDCSDYPKGNHDVVVSVVNNSVSRPGFEKIHFPMSIRKAIRD